MKPWRLFVDCVGFNSKCVLDFKLLLKHRAVDKGGET